MTEEARLESTSHGQRPASPGWFVLNVRDAAWKVHPTFGAWTAFEGDTPFEGLGVNVHLLEPGKPNCYYHRESDPEAFLVLSGTCRLIVEGQERQLGPFDFFHCPPGTAHVFIGGNDGPCALLSIGARSPDAHIHYPLDPRAQSSNACAPEPTDDPKQAYANLGPSEPCSCPWGAGG
jgi:uncharacterized cupin superfamily protein